MRADLLKSTAELKFIQTEDVTESVAFISLFIEKCAFVQFLCKKILM